MRTCGSRCKRSRARAAQAVLLWNSATRSTPLSRNARDTAAAWSSTASAICTMFAGMAAASPSGVFKATTGRRGARPASAATASLSNGPTINSAPAATARS